MISHKQIKNYIINFIGIKDILFKSNWISRKQNYENSYELAGKKNWTSFDYKRYYFLLCAWNEIGELLRNNEKHSVQRVILK